MVVVLGHPRDGTGPRAPPTLLKHAARKCVAICVRTVLKRAGVL
jgi:hypothetical protein